MDISTLKKEARFAIKEHFGTVIGTMVFFVLISIRKRFLHAYSWWIYSINCYDSL